MTIFSHGYKFPCSQGTSKICARFSKIIIEVTYFSLC